MTYRTATFVCTFFPPRRPGRVGPLLLAVLFFVFLFGILVINSFFASDVRVKQENATDAAALAAAEVLAQEALLYGDPSIFELANCWPADAKKNAVSLPSPQQALFCQAAHAAIEFGGKNFVAGKSFRIRPADLFFDIVDVPNRRIVGALPADPRLEMAHRAPLTLAQKRTINAVQVVGKSMCASENPIRFPLLCRSKVQMLTRLEAVLDGYVYGFYTDPEGSINIPMAPVALNASSWREQVETLVDPTFATPTNGPLPYGDFVVTIGAPPRDPDGYNPAAYSPMVMVGAASLSEALGQLNPKNPGITPAQYGKYLAANNQKPLALDTETLRLSVPAEPMFGSAELSQLEWNLQNLKGTRLVWPLFSGYDNPKGRPGSVTITGFVAARVLEVNKVTYSIGFDKHGKAMPKGKFKGLCKDRPRNDEHQPNFGNSEEHRRDDDPGKHDEHGGVHGKGKSCFEFSVIELTLRPTLLATSTGMVFVKNWPNGTQHQFRFPNAYVKRIRLMK